MKNNKTRINKTNLLHFFLILVTMKNTIKNYIWNPACNDTTDCIYLPHFSKPSKHVKKSANLCTIIYQYQQSALSTSLCADIFECIKYFGKLGPLSTGTVQRNYYTKQMMTNAKKTVNEHTTASVGSIGTEKIKHCAFNAFVKSNYSKSTISHYF